MNPEHIRNIFSEQLVVMERCSINCLYSTWFYVRGMIGMARMVGFSAVECDQYETLYRKTFFHRAETEAPKGRD